MQLTLEKRFFNSIVPITVYRSGEVSLGTAFIVRSSNSKLFLVTNRHVVEHAVSFEVATLLDDESSSVLNNPPFTSCDANYINLGFANNSTWFFHDNPAIDIAIADFSELKENYHQLDRIPASKVDLGGLKITHSFIDLETDILSQQQLETLPVVTPLIFSGYPGGLRDFTNGVFPITKAAISASPLSTNYKDKDKNLTNGFYIDSLIVNGSSGSPIFAVVDSNYYLVGIVTGGCLHDNIDTKIGTSIHARFIQDIISKYFEN